MPRPAKLPDPPDPEVWASAPTLQPEPTSLIPPVISDGGGLPFTPAAVDQPFGALDPADPPVAALLAQIELGRRRSQPKRLLGRRQPPPADADTLLAGWRALAASEDEILYGRGRPPQLLTVAVKRNRKGVWNCIGVSAARPLRAVREGARASSWRVDPTQTPGAQATELRLLVTEQSKATGVLAADRLLTPELYLDSELAVLRIYVRPLEGYVGPTRRHETPVIVRLPEPLGERRLLDGALYEVGGAGPAPAT